MKNYRELRQLRTFEERFEYLRLKGTVGKDTFGWDRYYNQRFYHSNEWKRIRDQIIIRDNGCDLGVDGYEIHGKILIHHMNPISINDIVDVSDFLMNPDYLICVSHQTHNAIHYGDISLLPRGPVERRAGDTCPWR